MFSIYSPLPSVRRRRSHTCRPLARSRFEGGQLVNALAKIESLLSVEESGIERTLAVKRAMQTERQAVERGHGAQRPMRNGELSSAAVDGSRGAGRPQETRFKPASRPRRPRSACEVGSRRLSVAGSALAS